MQLLEGSSNDPDVVDGCQQLSKYVPNARLLHIGRTISNVSQETREDRKQARAYQRPDSK